MTNTTTTKRRLIVPVAIVVASAASLAALTSGAWFTDTDTVANNTFSTGSISLTTTPTTAALTMANMAPGDVVTAPITVTNNGSLDLKYDLSGQYSGTLQPALQTAVKVGVTTCTTAGFAATGTSVYANAVVPTTKTLMSNDRALTAGASEVLCFQVTLPGAATANTYQNTTATGLFTFDSTQVAAP